MGPSSARQLKESDTAQFKKHIHDKYPTLKSDLAGLSDTLTSFVEFGCPPDRRLVLETLKDEDIPTKTLGELFTYCNEPLLPADDFGKTVVFASQRAQRRKQVTRGKA